MNRFKVLTYSWDAKTFFEVHTEGYKKGDLSWDKPSVSFEVERNEPKKEFVVESASDDKNCKNSPLKHLITECKGVISARIMREDEKLH